MFRLFAQEIDYLADYRTTNSQARQNLLVFKQDFIAYQPDKCVLFNPVPEQFGAWILGSNLKVFESRNSCHQDGCVDNASRPFSFWCGQRL